MNAGNLIFLLLIVGGALAMFSMHRGGGHAHGGMGGGGCHGGHSHDDGQSNEHAHETGAEQETKPLLGPPGTASNEPAPAPAAQGHRHRGC
jgi:hypothetical protein